MKRWVWRILLAAAALAALTVGALAAEGSSASGTPAAPKTPENKVTLDNGLVIRELEGGKWEVTGFAADYTGSRNPLIIPSSYGSVGADNITQIAAEAFKGAVKGKDIVTAIIPTSITHIGESAFEGCPKLETVVFLEHAKDDTNKLTIDEKAFLGCKELSNVMFSRGLGTIKPQAFGANLKLEEVVIPDGVSAIEERAFAQCANLKTIYIPASLKPAGTTTTKPIAATTFSGTGLVSIHYGGAAAERPDIQKIMDLPTGLDVWKDVHAAVNDRMITEPTCVEAGNVYGGVSCNAAAASKTDVCGSFVKIIDLPVLGHDYQQTPASKTAYETALAEHEKAPCKEQKYMYEATCYRCGEKIEREERVIPAEPGRHSWDGIEKNFDEETGVPATCGGPGSVSWSRTCPACGFVETGMDKPELQDTDKDDDGHTRKLDRFTPDETIEPTCASLGVEVSRRTCDCGEIVDSCEACAEFLEAIKAVEDEPETASEDADGGEDETPAPEETVLEKRAKAIENYIHHLEAEHGGEDSSVKFEKVDPVEHTWKEEYVETTPPTCTQKGVETKKRTCDVCGKAEMDPDDKQEIPALGHNWDKENASYKEEIIKAATCDEPGEKWTTGKCLRGEDCDGTPNEDGILTVRETIPASGHRWKEIGENDYVGPGDKAPTCTEAGRRTTGIKVCEICGKIEEPKTETVLPLGHKWGGFAPDPGQDAAQAEDCAERTVTGTVSCEREGCGETQERTITIPGKMSHNWDEWAFDTEKSVKTRTCKVCGKTEEQPLTSCAAHTWGGWTVVTEPTSAAEGLRKHVCRVCGAEETVKIPATGGSAAAPGTSKPDPNAEYAVTVTSGSGGTAAVSRTSAKAGTSVTVTVWPHSGFELDMIRVTGSATAKDLTGSQRSFTMPTSNVNVTVSFSPIDSGSGWGGASNGAGGDPTRSKDSTPVQITPQSIPRASAWGQIFSDIPTGHWAAGEINWANRMGYMNGTEGRFNPDEAITCQQMWMVLARLTGSYPANMADARRWAVEGGFADGSSPTAPVARHQLVTALYRCAYLKGGVSRSNASLAGYADSRVVPSAARDAFAWAVANGIVSGTSGNRLEPNGTLTRAQFAVILYRYSQRV